MPRVKLCLSSVRGRAELAERLNVDVRALSLINLVESVVCSSSESHQLGVHNNINKIQRPQIEIEHRVLPHKSEAVLIQMN